MVADLKRKPRELLEAGLLGQESRSAEAVRGTCMECRYYAAFGCGGKEDRRRAVRTANKPMSRR
jgi:hypothetical protein